MKTQKDTLGIIASLFFCATTYLGGVMVGVGKNNKVKTWGYVVGGFSAFATVMLQIVQGYFSSEKVDNLQKGITKVLLKGNEISEQNNLIKKYNKEMKELVEKLIDKQEDIDELKRTISELEDSAKSDIEDNNKELQEFLQKIINKQEKISDLNETITNLNKKIKSLENRENDQKEDTGTLASEQLTKKSDQVEKEFKDKLNYREPTLKKGEREIYSALLESVNKCNPKPIKEKFPDRDARFRLKNNRMKSFKFLDGMLEKEEVEVIEKNQPIRSDDVKQTLFNEQKKKGKESTQKREKESLLSVSSTIPNASN